MQTNSLGDQKRHILRFVERLAQVLDALFQEIGKSLPNRLKKYIFSIQAHAEKLRAMASDDSSSEADLDVELFAIAKRASELELEMIKSEADEEAVSHINRLLHIVRGSGLSAITSANSGDGQLPATATIAWQKAFREFDSAIVKAKADIADLATKQAQLRKQQLDDAKRTERTTSSVQELSQRLDESLVAAQASAESVIADLRSKQDEVNKLVGLISGTSIAGSYSSSAEVEKRWADATRNGSVFLMLAIVIVIGYSLLETGSPHFEWQTSLLRLLFSLALSVPTAYLARESSKHRLQQYSYMRTSLDLQSITPYLASLPEAEQHRLKAEMAARIFGGKDAATTSESYPINIQEILMALVTREGDTSRKQAVPKESKND